MPVADPDPMTAFTTRVFDSARAIESLRHAIETGDDALAAMAGSQLRGALTELDHVYDELEPSTLHEAEALAAHLRRRAFDVLAIAPGPLRGMHAIQRFLDRFASKR